MSAERLAEKLIGTVARAFYTDDVVLVIDTLIHDRYLRDDEMGARLQLSTKQVRNVMGMLGENGERLVRSEALAVPNEEGEIVKTETYW